METLNHSNIAYNTTNGTLRLSDTQKSQMVEHMMTSWEVPLNKQNDIDHALMIAMHADSQLYSKSTRRTIQSKMSHGIAGGINDVVKI
jgi:hypothetical protein